MATTSILDRYTRYRDGIPLNPELAAVQQGKVSFHEEVTQTEQDRTGQVPRSTEVVARDPTRSERVLLRELRAHEGWPVLMLVLGKKLDGIRKTTISKSQIDPLKNKDEIAESWAYLKLGERFVESLDGIVATELQMLEKEENAK